MEAVFILVTCICGVYGISYFDRKADEDRAKNFKRDKQEWMKMNRDSK
jgi:hypothetical protein